MNALRLRVAAEVLVLVLAGLFMGAIGPFGSAVYPGARRYLYWLACIVGGGMIGIAIDETLGRRQRGFWLRVAYDSLLMTPAVTALVIAVGWVIIGRDSTPRYLIQLLWQVLVISLAVMAFRALVFRPRRVETRTIIAPPLPEAEATFRKRLSAKRRLARLIAIEAHDHYLRVHTDSGVELISMRFADALEELAAAHGLRIHRSWWVAADAIQSVRWRRGAGEARLAADLTAPVSRSYAADVKAAGWF
jgi:hypothetical protein